MTAVRTRFAPSPTGYLHVGGTRTALFNWLLARKHGGSFILRVEDTDEARNTEAAREAIFTGMSLAWPGLGRGPPTRTATDQWRLRSLITKASATSSMTSGSRNCERHGRVYEDDGAWRFRFARKPVTMQDLICGEVTIDYRDESNTPDMVVKRSDGSYVFHFVNVVDDLEMKISHVLRGEDHLMNTPKHLQLFEAFGVEPPHLRPHSTDSQHGRLQDEQARHRGCHRWLRRGRLYPDRRIQFPLAARLVSQG